METITVCVISTVAQCYIRTSCSSS